jgi:membrane associated rhomboid family serine protease
MIITKAPYSNKISLTNITIVLVVIAYLYQQFEPNANLIYGLNYGFEYYRLWFQPLSTMFVHSGVFHLLMNMTALYQLGNIIEYYWGKGRLFLLYYIGGIATSLFSYYFMKFMHFNHNLIGASGAICLVAGYFAYKSPIHRKNIITTILLISFLPLLVGYPIGWYGHLIGLGIGWIVAKFI